MKVEINYDISNTSDQFPHPQSEVETEPNAEYLERPIYLAEEARGRITEEPDLSHLIFATVSLIQVYFFADILQFWHGMLQTWRHH